MIDWSRVNELQNEIGQDDFGEVVDLFLEEVDGVIETLKPGMSDMEAQLHFLKGSALNLGFSAFAQICQEGEQAAGQGTKNPVDVAELVDIYQASRAAFYSGLNTSCSA